MYILIYIYTYRKVMHACLSLSKPQFVSCLHDVPCEAARSGLGCEAVSSSAPRLHAGTLQSTKLTGNAAQETSASLLKTMKPIEAQHMVSVYLWFSLKGHGRSQEMMDSPKTIKNQLRDCTRTPSSASVHICSTGSSCKAKMPDSPRRKKNGDEVADGRKDGEVA